MLDLFDKFNFEDNHQYKRKLVEKKCAFPTKKKNTYKSYQKNQEYFAINEHAFKFKKYELKKRIKI